MVKRLFTIAVWVSVIAAMPEVGNACGGGSTNCGVKAAGQAACADGVKCVDYSIDPCDITTTCDNFCTVLGQKTCLCLDGSTVQIINVQQGTGGKCSLTCSAAPPGHWNFAESERRLASRSLHLSKGA